MGAFFGAIFFFILGGILCAKDNHRQKEKLRVYQNRENERKNLMRERFYNWNYVRQYRYTRELYSQGMTYKDARNEAERQLERDGFTSAGGIATEDDLYEDDPIKINEHIEYLRTMQKKATPRELWDPYWME